MPFYPCFNREFVSYYAPKGVIMDQHIDMIKSELENATKKHPLFCHAYSNSEKEAISHELDSIRLYNDFYANQGKQLASTILQEEVFEAEEAFLKGDFDSCLHELAQCGAVILRMMYFVETEKALKDKEV